MHFLTSIPFDQIEDIIFAFISHQTYLASVLLLFLEEAGLPLPTADFVIAYMGYHVALGSIPYSVAFVLLLIADLSGSSLLYYLCQKYGRRVITKFGHFIDLDQEKLDLVAKKFGKYGPLVIIFGRHIPGFRIPITVFSGISKMRYLTFISSTFISVVFWMFFYLSVGERLGPRTVKLLHTHGWFGLLFLLPIIFSLTPFLFLRKKKEK